MFKRRPKTIPRGMALTARPAQTPGLARKEMPEGGLGLSANITRKTWMRSFGMPEKFERTFQLDYLGRDVYDACNGDTDVQTIIRNFAAKHKVSLAEAELAVTTFLKTLMARGLIMMALDAPPVAPKETKTKAD